MANAGLAWAPVRPVVLRPMLHPPDTARTFSAGWGMRLRWLAVLAAVMVSFSLLWDYSWEFTIGVETVWAPVLIGPRRRKILWASSSARRLGFSGLPVAPFCCAAWIAS